MFHFTFLRTGISDLSIAIKTQVFRGRGKKSKEVKTAMTQVKEELCVLKVYVYVINNYNS